MFPEDFAWSVATGPEVWDRVMFTYREWVDEVDAADGDTAEWYAFTTRPGRKPLCQLGATSTGAEHTLLCEHRSAGATTLAERISAGASSQEPVNGYPE